MEVPYDPAILQLSMHQRNEISMSERHPYPTFIAALFTVATIWHQPRCSSADECIEKMWYICIMECFLAWTKKESLSFVTTWRNLESIMLSKISQTEKELCYMVDLICRILKSNSYKLRIKWFFPAARGLGIREILVKG
jgi:hypothetical protein